MKKQELLNAITAMPWCDGIVVEPELNEVKQNDDRWYHVNVREIKGNVMTYRNIHFYVINEGEPTERAYYKDIEPNATLKEKEIAAPEPI